MSNVLIKTGLPNSPLGLSDEDAQKLFPLYNAINSLTRQVGEVSGFVEYSQAELAGLLQFPPNMARSPSIIYAQASEPLVYGQAVHLHLSGGRIAAEPADATDNTKSAHGVVDQPQGLGTGEYGRVIIGCGFTAGIADTVVGQQYWLSVDGLVAGAAPTSPGAIIQSVGFGLGSLGFFVCIDGFMEVDWFGAGGIGDSTFTSNVKIQKNIPRLQFASADNLNPWNISANINDSTDGGLYISRSTDFTNPVLRIDNSLRVGIGTGTGAIEASALLQVASTSRGFLPPKMTEAQRDAISGATPGLMVFNTTTNKLNVRGGSAWEVVSST